MLPGASDHREQLGRGLVERCQRQLQRNPVQLDQAEVDI